MTHEREGIADGVFAWFQDHPISIGELIEDAVKKAVYQWLDDNREDILKNLKR